MSLSRLQTILSGYKPNADPDLYRRLFPDFQTMVLFSFRIDDFTVIRVDMYYKIVSRSCLFHMNQRSQKLLLQCFQWSGIYFRDFEICLKCNSPYQSRCICCFLKRSYHCTWTTFPSCRVSLVVQQGAQDFYIIVHSWLTIIVCIQVTRSLTLLIFPLNATE